MGIRVKATADGFFKDIRRKPGAKFTIDSEEQFSKKWMKKLSTRELKAEAEAAAIAAEEEGFEDDDDEEVEQPTKPAQPKQPVTPVAAPLSDVSGDERDKKIREALELLDHDTDEHWTKDGFPAMEVVEDLLNDKSITRENVSAAWSGFGRMKVKGEATTK